MIEPHQFIYYLFVDETITAVTALCLLLFYLPVFINNTIATAVP